MNGYISYGCRCQTCCDAQSEKNREARERRRKARAALASTPAPAPGAGLKPLPPRQQQVLELIADGCDQVEMAQRLGLSVYTVREYRESLYTTLGARSAGHAVAIGYQRGYLPAERRSP